MEDQMVVKRAARLLPRLMVSGRSLWHIAGMPAKLLSASLVLLALTGCTRVGQQACTPRRAYWNRPHNFEGLFPPLHTLSLTADGAIYLNGSHITFSTLRKNLALMRRLNPPHDVFLETEMGAPCATLDRVRDEMDRQLDCRNGRQCNEGILSVWKGLPTPPGVPPS